MKKVINLYRKHEEIINYLIVGGATTTISLAIKWILLFTICDANNPFELQISVVISWVVAALFAYVANRVFVFKSKNKKILSEAISFFFARLATLLLEMLMMYFFVTFLGLNSDAMVLIITIIIQVVIIVCNYLTSKIFVFKKKK